MQDLTQRGTDLTEIGIWITLAGFILQAVGYLIVGTWKLSQMEANIRADITAERKQIDHEFDSLRREFGETVSAVRQKIGDVEIYLRDTYVRRDSFHEMVRQQNQLMENMFAKIDTRLERMEEKIDSRRA